MKRPSTKDLETLRNYCQRYRNDGLSGREYDDFSALIWENIDQLIEITIYALPFLPPPPRPPKKPPAKAAKPAKKPVKKKANARRNYR